MLGDVGDTGSRLGRQLGAEPLNQGPQEKHYRDWTHNNLASASSTLYTNKRTCKLAQCKCKQQGAVWLIRPPCPAAMAA